MTYRITDPPQELVEYVDGAERWRCSMFHLLVGEFEEIRPEDMPRFHDAMRLHPRRWQIIRMLFGIRPVLAPPSYPEDELQEWGRLELCEKLGLTPKQLGAELEAARGAWLAARRWDRERQAEAQPKPSDAVLVATTDEDLLKKYQFDGLELNESERKWFFERVRQFQKVLDEPIVSGLGRNALVAELRSRRLDARVDSFPSEKVGSKEWRDLLATAQNTAKSYNELIEKILDLFPAASNIAGKQALQPVISTITRAIQEFHSRNSTRLVDGIFTATEVQVECRRSAQSPEPRYRAGLVLYLNAARAGLFDPQWKPPFTASQLKKIDAAWKAAYIAAAEQEGEPLPDLRLDGPKGEYEPLEQPHD